jgi:hypothetical protein
MIWKMVILENRGLCYVPLASPFLSIEMYVSCSLAVAESIAHV